MVLPQDAKIQIAAVSFEGGVAIVPAYIVRLLQNLVRNAGEAYQRMTHTTDSLIISIDCHCDDKELHLTISDYVPGIDSAIAAHIFQAHVTTKAEQRLPTGLGLASARELAHIMHGRLEYRQRPQAGAKFILKLPLVTASK